MWLPNEVPNRPFQGHQYCMMLETDISFYLSNLALHCLTLSAAENLRTAVVLCPQLAEACSFSKLLVQVSTAGVDEAHQYMLQQTRQLVAQAKLRGGIKAEVSHGL